MATREVPAAPSSLLIGLLERDELCLTEATRTRCSVHYETGLPHVPVLTVATPEAVRLPNTLLTRQLPPPGPARVGQGGLHTPQARWLPRRWWRPPRPQGLHPPADPDPTAGAHTGPPVPTVPLPTPANGLDPDLLVGAGRGLTPEGDDLLAGALVAASATADPRLPAWRAAVRAALRRRRTTVVSRALLHHALDGYATPELAAFIEALCRGTATTQPLRHLLGVGHTSGVALLAGVRYTLTTTRTRGAA